MTFDILSLCPEGKTLRENVSIFISREQASGREEEARKRGRYIEGEGGRGIELPEDLSSVADLDAA